MFVVVNAQTINAAGAKDSGKSVWNVVDYNMMKKQKWESKCRQGSLDTWTSLYLLRWKIHVWLLQWIIALAMPDL